MPTDQPTDPYDDRRKLWTAIAQLRRSLTTITRLAHARPGVDLTPPEPVLKALETIIAWAKSERLDEWPRRQAERWHGPPDRDPPPAA